MAIIKTWNAKSKCWNITRNAKTLKEFSAMVGKQIPVVGQIGVAMAKEFYLLKLKHKNYCKEDIAWVKKNI